MPILLCRTLWLNHYDARRSDTPSGNHRWFTEKGRIPHEIHNFRPTEDGRYYGFVQVGGSGNINVKRLDNSATDQVGGVTVVWCAQHEDGRGIVVTGWYRNATVYRVAKERPREWKLDEGEWLYQIEGRVSDSHLLAPSSRNLVLQPRGTPKTDVVFGMSDLAYIGTRRPSLAAEIERYVEEQGRFS